MEFDPREQKVQLIDSGGLTPGGLMDGKFSSECKCGERCLMKMKVSSWVEEPRACSGGRGRSPGGFPQ